LTRKRSSAGAIVTSNRLYVVGGYADGAGEVANVDVATVDGAGNLGAFAAANALPAGLSDVAPVAIGNGFFLFGGRIPGGTATDIVRFSSLDGGGGLGGFADTAFRLADRRANAGAVVLGKWAYVIGGLVQEAEQTLDTIQRARVPL
jgi:hypothetical protein